MRRFVTLALLLIFSIPVGISISGCSKAIPVEFCNGGSSGMVVGQITTINLEPRLYGISLNYGSIGQISSPSSLDCKGNAVGVPHYTYGTTNFNYADVSPSGSLCAGSWNRNTPGGVPDYTTCTPPASTLLLPSTPVFTTPTAPAATTGATATLNYGAYTTGINGLVDISLAGGPTLTGSISDTVTPAEFAAAFNAIGAFSSAGIVATSTATSVVVTGPVGATKTLLFTGTNLAGYVPAAFITASAGGAVSNPVPIYVHSAVSSIVLQPQSACYSQGTTVPLTANVFTGTGTNITSVAGPLFFSAQDSSVLSINSTVVPPVGTAQLPGSTILSASTSNSASSSSSSASGIFYTCPPKSITLSVPGTSSTNINLNLNTPQALNASVIDTNNNPITGLTLEYVSTSPRSLQANSSGSVSAIYPGSGAVTAICQPPSCNNAPLNQLGINGNGLPVASNPVQVTTPGTVNTALYMASTTSQYFNSVDFQTGQVGTPVRLPYVPNSMLSDQAGQTLFFGSLSELMEVSSFTNAVVKEDASVKGTVVGVSNDGSIAVISDSVRQLIYIYNVSSATSTSFGGTATHAVFSPDDQFIYITGSDSIGDVFFVYSGFTGWHAFTAATLGATYTPPVPSITPVDVAVTVPSIGAYLAGATTNAVGYCSSGTPPTAANGFVPLADHQAVITDRIAATNNSQHILGAAASTKQLTDLYLAPAANVFTTPSNCTGASSNPPTPVALKFVSTPFNVPLGVTPATITGVIPSADSTVAFVTYTTAGSSTTGTVLPAYKPAAGTVGTLTPVTLSSGASAPVSGIFSPDGQTFYTGTSGDNLVHLINVPTLTDTKTVAPSLPICTSQDPVTSLCNAVGTGTATPNLLADRPRPTT